MTEDKIKAEISHHFVMCHGEPSHWSVCLLPNINNRESAEQIEQQILKNDEIVERLKAEINKTLYLKNTISPNIPAQSTAYEIYEEFLLKLQSILEPQEEKK